MNKIKEFSEQIEQEELEKKKKIDLVISELKKTLTKYKFKKLMEFVVDCDHTYGYEIVNKDKTFGEKQNEDYWFKFIYIKQSTGYICDSYNGTIFIPITKDGFFKFSYDM